VPGFAGPLAGILAGLDWAAANAPDIAWVGSVPGDCPFLPRDLIGRARGKRFVALSGLDRIVFDQDLAYVEEESAKHRRKAAVHDD
jgi:molybdopterin-guanine dinucleotide biosynthesis protein A